jgi:ethanolamine utilization protein EutA
VATADDPCLESWLAFMGACGPLSRAHPAQSFLNLDVGGGTTNLALGRDGEVTRTGCLFVGARHVRVEPGTYRVVKLSRYARALFDGLGIRGDVLAEREVEAIVYWYVRLLEAAVTGDESAFADPLAKGHVQVPYRPPDPSPVAVTFSGGVGELIYAHLAGEPWPGTTHFGDLGIDLARGILGSPVWEGSLAAHPPASAGRATVYGLLRHSTEISGSTLYLPDPALLPLADVPILGAVSPSTSDDDLRELLALAARSARGGGVRVVVGSHDAQAVRSLGGRLADALEQVSFPPRLPLVLLVRENVGKTLGHYVTRWGRSPLSLLVIDEVTLRDAQYAQIGSPRGPIVPVSFYGLNPRGDVSCSR